MKAPSSPPRASSAAIRAIWFVIVPALMAGWVLRYLVPAPAAARGTWAEPIARAGEHSLVFYFVLFSVFVVLLRYWGSVLTGARTERFVAEAEAPRRWVLRGAIALAVCSLGLFARSFVTVRAVRGTAMLPTLEPDDLIAGSRLALGSHPSDRAPNAHLPRRGDIVMFNGQEDLGDVDAGILRVIGLPGDHVAMLGNAPVINGWQVPVCRAATYTFPVLDDAVRALLVVEFLGEGAHLALYDPSSGGWPRTYDVKEGEVFVLGDNRANAEDSRVLNRGMGGGVPLAALEARGQRWVIGKRRDGVTDFSRWFLPIDGQLHLDGIDATQTREAIQHCLELRPAEINPPEPSAESSQTAQGG